MPYTSPFDLPIDVAAAQARAARVMLSQEYYGTLPAAKRAQAFTVSGLARLDQIQAVADALAKKQAEGSTFAEFKKWAGAQDWGIKPAHLETIYRNGVQTAYMAGHFRAFEANRDAFPFLMYDAINDSRTRPHHLALDGVIKPVGDAFWRKNPIPGGHRCRCSARSLSAAEARARGGVTQNVPAEGGADEGWEGDPREWGESLSHVISRRLDSCSAYASLAARGKLQAPLWCSAGRVRDFTLMQQAWAQRGGAMPEPVPLNLPQVQKDRPEVMFDRFMDEFGGGISARVDLPSGDTVVVSDDLFRFQNGQWKIGKRGRDAWLLYLAALIKEPQEVWRLKRAQSEELYLLGRFQRGKQRIDAVAAFRREGDSGEWMEGASAYVFDKPDGLDKKRAELLKSGSVSWIEM